MVNSLLIYGANGYTGRLIAEEALRKGITPLLAGRRPEVLLPLAEQLGCESRVFPLDDPTGLRDNLKGVSVVLHAAGPFTVTAKPMVDACLEEGAHYLDITGETDVFESLAARDAEAQAAGIMVMPGTGMDVVPSDGLALYLKEKLPDAENLELALCTKGGISHGTATTMVHHLDSRGLLRRENRLVPGPAGALSRQVDFGRGPRGCVSIPWGDIATAWRTTGIPNVTVYMAAPSQTRFVVRATRFLGPLLRRKFVKQWLQRRVDAAPPGPTPEARASGYALFWGKVTAPSGQSAEAWMATAEGYTFTARASVEIARRALAGELSVGYATPAGAYGSDLPLSVKGTVREDDREIFAAHLNDSEKLNDPLVATAGSPTEL